MISQIELKQQENFEEPNYTFVFARDKKEKHIHFTDEQKKRIEQLSKFNQKKYN